MINNSLIAAASFTPSLLQAPSAWLGHLPFAAWIIKQINPGIFVELGAHHGHSYFAFCQAVSEEGLSSKCYAVDTWQGDEHAGEYSDDVFSNVSNHERAHYSDFSRLLRMTFDDAAAYFTDGSIDLLHIDGLHTYEAVRHDFETWLPKLAPGAVVMFHDTNVRERSFGVWKLWEELQANYPNNFEFLHSHGLGVLQLNSAPKSKEIPWLHQNFLEKQQLKDYFSSLGSRQLERFDFSELKLHASNLNQTIASLNQAIASSDEKINELNEQAIRLNQVIVNHIEYISKVDIATIERDELITGLTEAAVRKNVEIVNLTSAVHERDSAIQQIHASTSWRLTIPFRAVGTISSKIKLSCLLLINKTSFVISMLPAALRHSGNYKKLFLAFWSVFQREGLHGVKRRVMFLSAKKTSTASLISFFDRSPSDKYFQQSEEKSVNFKYRPLISILVPVFNPNPKWLIKTVESVISQIYENWELCIVDDASTDIAIRSILERYALADTRIKVIFRSKNGNISAASNDALGAAKGEYLALLDHDDELTSDALWWVVKEIELDLTADVIYSDEDKISVDGGFTDVFHKPDWSPEFMFNCMYIGHLTVYKKSLIDEVGGFRSEFDFSQDYDLALRATEHARSIKHIPRVLYHWRQAEGSAAQGGKPYARLSNLAALQAAVDRRGISAQVLGLPCANRVKLAVSSPKVSIVIPTDSESNLITCLDSIAANTSVSNWNVVVVTNSVLTDKLAGTYRKFPLEFCRYDKPYNFSDKCNQGAHQADGEIVIFFNDDVRPLSRGWLDDLVELLAIPGVGAVAPKLIYENHQIQHAGLVTGVRGQVGTAFHCVPENSSHYFNFAQSVRNVSALSGACFAMRRSVFIDVGGFDAVNTPIMHSDIDLSFKVREIGLRCVYTPYATLLHIGHQSLNEYDKKKKKNSQDKADLFLMKRWGGYLSYDPYFTDKMRDHLYHDSPEAFLMLGQNHPDSVTTHPDVLLVTHDLSSSGAPMVVHHIAKSLLAAGAFPVVASPVDGPMREMFHQLGIQIIVDSLLLTGHESVEKLARNFDCVLANTVATWPLVHQLMNGTTPLMWYLHEGHLIQRLAESNPQVDEALRCVSNLYAGSERAASFCKPFNGDVKILTYGVPDIYLAESDAELANSPIVFSVFGTLEPRKGQDIFLEAIQLMGKSIQGQAIFHLVGRTLDETWANTLRDAARGLNNLVFHGNVEHSQYVELMRRSHIVVCPSRDDTLPLVTLDALGLGKTLICTTTTGTSKFMTHGKDGFVVPSENAQALAKAMMALVESPNLLAGVGTEARKTFLRHFGEDEFSRRIVAEIRTLSRAAS